MTRWEERHSGELAEGMGLLADSPTLCPLSAWGRGRFNDKHDNYSALSVTFQFPLGLKVSSGAHVGRLDR